MRITYPVHSACHRGDVEAVEAMINRGINVNLTKTPSGATLLYIACFKGHIDVAKLLIEKGANISQATTDTGATPLSTACKRGHADVVKVLIEAGAYINQARIDNRWTPFVFAAFYGHVEILSMLVIEGADEDIRSTIGENALDIATRKGKLAEYESAFTETALAAAKLRFGRTLVEETIIPAMTAVNTSTDNGRDLSRISHRSIPASADLDAELFWREDVAELVFSFLDRHGLIDLE